MNNQQISYFKQALVMLVAVMMVFTYMPSGTWGADTAWATEAWDGTTTTQPQQVNDVYQISTGAELAWFAALVNGETASGAKAVLTANIDLGGKEWTPIGKNNTDYGGTFDGQGHTISNIYISTHDRYVGFFKSTYYATIKNVTLQGEINITDAGYASNFPVYYGGLVGNAKFGEFINCASRINITITANNEGEAGRRGLGGLFGNLKNGKAIACRNYGNLSYGVTAWGEKAQIGIGGIAGEIQSTTIDGAYNWGTISVK